MKMQKYVSDIPDKVKIINVPISNVNLEIALNFIINNFENIRGSYICASNVHTTVMAHENEDYLKVQSESIISLPDGKPLSVIGKKYGYKKMEKTTGTNFMKSIFTDKRFKDKKHYFYGNTKEDLDRMINELKINYKGLKICGYEPSIYRELNDKELEELITRINKSNADFVWVGTGAPRQEILMNRMNKRTNSIMTGVGGAFNILAGKIKESPKWMQDMGLEWLYRLSKEPKRLFKRYFITNSKFLFYLVSGK